MQIKLISDQDVTRIRALLDCYQLAPSGPVADGLLAEAAKILEWHQQSCDILAGATINDITERQHQPAGAGWIEWKGGQSPVEGTTMVEVLYRNGKIEDGHSFSYRWEHFLATDEHAGAWDILAYRLIKSEACPA